MKINLISYTPKAEELLLFTKDTRLRFSPGKLEGIETLPYSQKIERLQYVLGTISSSWEFIDYIFVISDVTRAFTHQLVRHRVGTSFAQQAQRVADMSGFDYLIPDDFVSGKDYLLDTYKQSMKEINNKYQLLLHQGARPQDARGVLPTNIYTNIIFKTNLRALSTMLETRLCVRAQGEFQKVAHGMKGAVVQVHPWAEPVLNCFCVRYGRCRWVNYTECPVRREYAHLLDPLEWEETDAVKTCLEEYTGYDPQPNENSWSYDNSDSK